ncbi:hypothetical protein CK203_109424 [Vitis vinifera]|uniref:Chromo domain-containing protein n=1 Tax=Vitis vinifera TaxID=29760 RepID=A0A438CVY3_VITVI|nr:hypothetical protein CK203_109424 [Vitis vinifera]
MLQPLPILEWKWDHITMDFVIGLPRTKSKKNGVWEIVRLHRIPFSIVSDKDPKFTSQFWKEFTKGYGDLQNIQISEDTSYVEEPLQTLEVGEHRFRNKVIPTVKVWWQHQGMEETTWEPKEEMR